MVLPCIPSCVFRACTVVKYTAHVPPYEEVIVEQQWARKISDPLQIIDNIRAIVDSVMSPPDVFSHPLFVGIMEGIRSEYNMMQKKSVPQRWTMSHGS